MEESDEQLLAIGGEGDTSRARGIARAMAESIGFDDKVSEEIAIAVSELASNLNRHSKGGQLRLARISNGARPGIQIEAHDSGPGIIDVEGAIADGFSTVGGLGCGLGTVNRLMDEFDIRSLTNRESGTHIVCRRWLARKGSVYGSCPLSIGAATRGASNVPN